MFKSGEHAFQYRKAKRFNKTAAMQAILDAPTPHSAKKLLP